MARRLTVGVVGPGSRWERCRPAVEGPERVVDVRAIYDVSHRRATREAKRLHCEAARSLADLLEFPDLEALRTTYLKLDTQGFDLEVLRGGPRAASVIPALQSEVSFEPIYENMPDYLEAIAEFGRHGFAVSDMFLVNPEQGGIAIEFDCVMVRRAGERQASS